MLRTSLTLVFAVACAVDHTGLLSPGGGDVGPAPDVAQDVSPSPDALSLPDVPDSGADVHDGGPDVPLPMDCTVHVAMGGSDEASGSAVEPLQTIGAALATEMPVICVGEGAFGEMLQIDHDVRIRGGYCDGFMRQGCDTDVRGPSDRVVLIDSGGPARLTVELLDISFTTGNAVGAGGSTYGIQVIRSDLRIRNSVIHAKDGNAGADAPTGATGEAGQDGGHDGRRSGGGYCSTGGTGGNTDLFSGDGGTNGEGASGSFGLGGPPGSSGNGVDGTDGEASRGTGGPGAGGHDNGSVSFDAEFQPMAGEAGGRGPAGGGGGGGGAGDDGINNVGGGGGGGGCGGVGGPGGRGGGGSFAIVAVESNVMLEDVVMLLGRGGNGGTGGDGGMGGPGGSGRSGGEALAGEGGRGGAGGQGGLGGQGGGGQGGPAIGVLLGDSRLSGSPTLQSGAGGDGGAGGAEGAPGEFGERLTLNLHE